MKTFATKTLVDGLVFAEGPRWHDNKLWFSDMFGGKVHTVDLEGKLETIVEVEHPSGLGWLPDGRLIIVGMKDRALLAFDKGVLSTYCDLSEICQGVPNDMVIDAQGRAYVGNIGCDLFAGEEPKPAELVLVENGVARVVVPAPEMVFPNGTVITPDGKTLIIAESWANRLTAFDIDIADGSLSGRRIFADLGERDPDGICLDAQGAVWIGTFEKGEFARVLDGGEVTHVIDTGGRRAAACMTGGPGRNTLFMISSATTHDDLVKGISSSRIDIAEIDVSGAGLP